MPPLPTNVTNAQTNVIRTLRTKNTHRVRFPMPWADISHDSTRDIRSFDTRWVRTGMQWEAYCATTTPHNAGIFNQKDKLAENKTAYIATEAIKANFIMVLNLLSSASSDKMRPRPNIPNG